MIELLYGDCLELMKDMPDKSIDAIITDPPYGTTACKWDSVIHFEPMWEQIKKVRKEHSAVALFGIEPFSSVLRMSNIKEYKYDWIWKKTSPSNYLNSKKQPLRIIESISIFYKKQSLYFPQGLVEGEFKTSRPAKNKKPKSVYGQERVYNNSKFGNYPKNLLEFANPKNKNQHPTQKPVELLEYLIKTYTNEGDTILDFTMGSGSTGVACINTNRNFIGIEKEENYFEIAKNRIEQARQEAEQKV